MRRAFVALILVAVAALLTVAINRCTPGAERSDEQLRLAIDRSQLPEPAMREMHALLSRGMVRPSQFGTGADQ